MQVISSAPLDRSHPLFAISVRDSWDVVAIQDRRELDDPDVNLAAWFAVDTPHLIEPRGWLSVGEICGIRF